MAHTNSSKISGSMRPKVGSHYCLSGFTGGRMALEGFLEERRLGMRFGRWGSIQTSERNNGSRKSAADHAA
jgi:hypothetical protein